MLNNNVEPGDLFLFFGNFHFVEWNGQKYKYVKQSGDFYKDNDLQVVWGYLQVGDIVMNHQEQRRYWWHPHSIESRANKDTNIIFRASNQLSFDTSKPGAGLLAYDEKRVMTLYGELLPEPAYEEAVALIRYADMLIIGGTSLEVGSAAQLAHMYHGKYLVIINKGKTKMEGKAEQQINFIIVDEKDMRRVIV